MAKAVVLKKGFFVAGHPRSGTSLVCQLAESGGVDFPSDFEGDEYNKEGYYELAEAKELSKNLLAEAMTPENTRKMNDIVRKLNDIDGWPGLKLVRIPAIFFYRHLAKKMKAIFVYRNPANVKASLFKRGLGEFPISWLKNSNALIAAYENIEDSIIVSYESLLEQKQHVRAGFSRLGLEVDLQRVMPDRQTQKDSRIYLTEDEKNMYSLLQKLEKESCQ